MARKTKTARRIAKAKKEKRNPQQEPSGMFPELWGTWEPNAHTQDMVANDWGQEARTRQICILSKEDVPYGYKSIRHGKIYTMCAALSKDEKAMLEEHQ